MAKLIDFVLTLGEHDWDEEQMEDEQAARVEALRRVNEEGWRKVPAGKSKELAEPEAQMQDLASFRALAEAQLEEMLEGSPFVAEVITAVCDRAAELIKAKNATLRAGWAYGFEGNHNDTTFLLRLSVPS
jgi:hypothetical protein